MLCVAFTTADTWLGSFIIARTTPYMITGLGYGTYFVFASILMAMGLWAMFFVPETKGKFSPEGILLVKKLLIRYRYPS